MNEWKNEYSHLETKVGGGFYALRELGKGRSKLVRADRSPVTNIKTYATTPSVGQRTDRPMKRRARRNNV